MTHGLFISWGSLVDVLGTHFILKTRKRGTLFWPEERVRDPSFRSTVWRVGVNPGGGGALPRDMGVGVQLWI